MSAPVPPSTFASEIRLTEFDQLGSVFANWQGQIEQISGGSFEGDIQVVSGSMLRIVASRGNRCVRVRGRDASGMLAIYPLIAGMASAVWTGRRHESGQIYVGGSEDETDICSGRAFSGRAAFIHPKTLVQSARALLGTEEHEPPRDSRLCSPSPADFAEVDRRLNRLLRDGLADPPSLSSPEGHRREQECVRALVASLAPTNKPQVRMPLSNRSQLIRRAEEYLRAHLGDHVGIVDVCQELGTSDRTLRLAFREWYGVGPMTYFRFLRLNAVHAKLRADSHAGVADVAQESGFHHLGNFAADYRRLFGMLPSETERPS